MIENQIFIPSFRNRKMILRTIFALVMVAVFLAIFEVGLVGHWSVREGLKQFYFHVFFLLSAGALIIAAFELLRTYFFQFSRQSILLRIVLLSVTMLCLATLWVNIFHHMTGMQTWSNKSVILQLIFHSLLGLIVVSFGLHYFDIQKRSIQQHSAELQYQVFNLESRMQPHFFFNSMNSLLCLVESKDDKAVQFVEDMASFFRVSLRPMQMVSAKQEVATCERYLNIEKLRLSDQFEVTWDIPEPHDLQMVLMPSLSLQPIFDYLITEGTQYTKMNIECRASLTMHGRDEIFEVLWHAPRIAETIYVEGLETLLDNLKVQLTSRLGDQAQLFLQQTKLNHTIKLIFPINSVI